MKYKHLSTGYTFEPVVHHPDVISHSAPNSEMFDTIDCFPVDSPLHAFIARWKDHMKQNHYKFIVAGMGSNGRPVAYFTNDKPFWLLLTEIPGSKI